MNSEELVKSVLKDVRDFTIDDVPNLELYMDQVTTYLNNKFSASKRHEEDKLLTKTMINNYAKSRLLPPPEKKKYSKDHIIVLALIFFFKNVISINDVTTVLKPLLDKYFHNDDTPLEDIVNVFLHHVQINDMTNPIIEEFNESVKIFENIESDDKEYLQTLGLISMLSYDMFVRKMLIEKLIDSLPENNDLQNPKENKKDNKTKKEANNKKETD